MLIGLTADNYKKLPISFVLQVFNWMGIGFSEVTTSIFSHPRKGSKSTRGMKLGLHLPNVGNSGFDISSVTNRDRVESVLHHLNRYGSTFDFEYAVFHPPEEDPQICSYAYYIENLHRIRIPLFLENTRAFPLQKFIHFYTNIKKELGDSLSGMCLDIPHAYLTGEDWRDYYQAFQSDVKLIHLSNCDDDEDRHRPFGMEGSLDLGDILRTLSEFGYDGILNFEIKPPSLRHLDLVFGSYLQARQVFQPHGIRPLRRQMRAIGLLARILGLIVHI